MCITYPDHIATYLTGNQVVTPLDDLFADEKYGLGGSEVLFDSPSKEEVIPEFLEECNRALAAEARKQTGELLGKVLYEASMGMRNGFARSDA